MTNLGKFRIGNCLPLMNDSIADISTSHDSAESLQLGRWNLNSTSNSPVAPRRTELSDFRESARSGN